MSKITDVRKESTSAGVFVRDGKLIGKQVVRHEGERHHLTIWEYVDTAFTARVVFDFTHSNVPELELSLTNFTLFGVSLSNGKNLGTKLYDAGIQYIPVLTGFE